jgi:hypothetical protein
MAGLTATPPVPRQDPHARAQFAREFAAAVLAIKKLDQRGESWAKNAEQSGKPIDLNGQETTQQLSFIPPDPRACEFFKIPPVHRLRKNNDTEWREQYFRDKSAFDALSIKKR